MAIMTTYTATVIKSGNSYALRIPKAYADRKQLRVGQKVNLTEDSLVEPRGNVAQLMKKFQEESKTRGDIGIPDPRAWQREIRKDTSPWEEIRGDISR